jgi:sterol desaturase/sphingolipid hydroxylase (fatty acid hydroxylase superfamily)
VFFGSQYWKDSEKFLDKLSWREFFKAYLSYPSIQAYFFLGVIFAGYSIYWMGNLWAILISIAGCFVIYPLAEHCIHRYILHARFLYQFQYTASLWKRIHFDHHQNPNDLRVLFAAPHTILPVVFIIAAPLGWWVIGGPGGCAGAVAAGLWYTCFYEYCHCVEHLNYTPRSNFFRTLKKLHLAHHFHNEHGNYGITNAFPDRILGTYYVKSKKIPFSPTVFNLGYTGEEASRFPWVAELSEMPIGERSAPTPPPRTRIS